MHINIKPFILIMALAMSLVCNATGGPHGEFPEWGGVTIEELMMKECSFEKDADALLLLDLSEVYFNKDMDEAAFRSGKFHITTAYYQRYKIFTANGTRKANRSNVVDIDDDQDITHIRAICYELVDGKIKKTELRPEDIHTSKISERRKEVSFTVPGVSPGCVFEWSYEETQGVTSTLPSWYFNTDVPSAYCRLTVGFVSCLNYYEDKHTFSSPIQTESEPFISQINVPARYIESYNGFTHLKGTAVSYTTRNLPSYNLEPYTNTTANYLTWIGFQFSGYGDPYKHTNFYNSFDDVSAHLYRSPAFTAGLDKNPIPKKEMASIVHKGMTADAKARAINEYIRRNIKWTGGGGIDPGELPATVWKNKAGSWPEISLLLISALRSEGISAYPIVVGSRHNVAMNKVHPILTDYIGMDVLCVLDEAGTVVIDPTERHLPFGQPDLDQIRTAGLVIEAADNCYWYDIEDHTDSREEIVIDAYYDETGRITGTMDLRYTGHSSRYLISQKSKDNKDAIRSYLQAEMPGATIEESTDTAYDDQAAFVYHVRFSSQAAADNEGNVFVSMASAFGSVTDPFVHDQRLADVDLGYKYKTDIRMTLHMPDGYALDKTVPLFAAMPDSSATFMSSTETDGRKVIFKELVRYNKPLFTAAEYSAFFNFQKKYYDLRQKPVMLRKKS